MWRPLIFIQALRHATRADDDRSGWVGVDLASRRSPSPRADGREVTALRTIRAMPPCANNPSSQNDCPAEERISNERAALRLARHHTIYSNVRRHFLHRFSNAMVNTHNRLVIKDLNVFGMFTTTASPVRLVTRAGLHSSDSFAIRLNGVGEHYHCEPLEPSVICSHCNTQFLADSQRPSVHLPLRLLR